MPCKCLTCCMVQILLRTLKAKNIYHFFESPDVFAITSQSIEQTNDQRTILRFHRQYDLHFAPNIEQVWRCAVASDAGALLKRTLCQ